MLALVLCFFVLGGKQEAIIKSGYMLFAVCLPFAFCVFYSLHEIFCFRSKKYKKFTKTNLNLSKYLAQKKQGEQVFDYLQKTTGFFACETNATYFGNAKEYFNDLLFSLKSAKEFIFIEMYLIRSGRLFDKVLNVLKRKSLEGVEIIVMIDAVGSMELTKHIKEMVKGYDISVITFNKSFPFFDLKINSRTHRKIVVIDGKIGYVGGINIIDEYAYGDTEYKDCALKLVGIAVNNLTAQCLQLFATCGKNLAVDRYFKSDVAVVKNALVLPYSVSPTREIKPHKQLLLKLFYEAKKRVIIVSPYFSLDGEMIKAIKTLVDLGVKVIVVVQNAKYKGLWYGVAKAYLVDLVNLGVEVYTFDGGFLHQKTVIVDDYAILGSANFDLRSFNFQFESQVLLQGEIFGEILFNVKQIVLKSKKFVVKSSPFFRAKNKILKVFSPIV